MIVLGSIVVIGASGALILAVLDQPLPEIIIVLGAVAAGGLARLRVPSPLSQRKLDHQIILLALATSAEASFAQKPENNSEVRLLLLMDLCNRHWRGRQYPHSNKGDQWRGENDIE